MGLRKKGGRNVTEQKWFVMEIGVGEVIKRGKK
jgi:hypothetical protein